MSNDAAFVILVILGLIAVDVVAVAYGVHVGMKYPFIAAAMVNVAIILATNIAGLIWVSRR